MQFTNGWVQETKVFVPDNCDNVVVLTKVSSTSDLDLDGYVDLGCVLA